MSSILHFNNDSRLQLNQEVIVGLQKKHKYIPTAYLYDNYGCQLFNRITRHQDYYLTRTELSILKRAPQHLVRFLGNKPFNLVELGPGEGLKTMSLISEFLKKGLNFRYIPIDINNQYLEKIILKFNAQFAKLDLLALHGDYFKGINWLRLNTKRKNFVLFLGSSIGNFTKEQMLNFLSQLHKVLHKKDIVLIGFDLDKDESVLNKAYNDSDGLTADFNLNLLRRLNRELGAQFDINQFSHFPFYNPQNHAMESYLVSNQLQDVYIEAYKQYIHFNEKEKIFTECSNKYRHQDILHAAQSTGYRIIHQYYDSKHYFVDSLWEVK